MKIEEKNIILNDKQIRSKLKRISYQIVEKNMKNSKLIIAGIEPHGYKIAKELQKITDSISKLDVQLCKVTIDKEKPRNPVKTSLKESDYTNKSIVLVDDVLNSGSTLIYGVRHFLNVELKQFKTAVLVNRNHKKFPVKADFKGISLSTSMQNHVKVEFKGSNIQVILI